MCRMFTIAMIALNGFMMPSLASQDLMDMLDDQGGGNDLCREYLFSLRG